MARGDHLSPEAFGLVRRGSEALSAVGAEIAPPMHPSATTLVAHAVGSAMDVAVEDHVAVCTECEARFRDAREYAPECDAELAILEALLGVPAVVEDAARHR